MTDCEIWVNIVTEPVTQLPYTACGNTSILYMYVCIYFVTPT